MFTITFACRGGIERAAVLLALQAAGLDQAAGVVAFRVLENAARVGSDGRAPTLGGSRKRRGALPSEPNAGSVFKNPEGDYAGRLIEACGLKGEQNGGALISPRRANVIVNTGNAPRGGRSALMKTMRNAVRGFGVTLMPEVKMLGLKWE